MASLPVLEMTKRSQEIFNIIVNNYLETGTPVGSGVISKHPEISLSSASVRAIMAELEVPDYCFHHTHLPADCPHMPACACLWMV